MKGINQPIQIGLVLILVVSLLAGLWVFYGRAVDEGSADSVALVVDLNEISVLARAAGQDPASMLASIKETGVTAVAVPEKTPAALHAEGRLSLFSGEELLVLLRLTDRLGWPADLDPARIKPEYTYLHVTEDELIKQVRDALVRRVEEVQEYQLGGGTLFVVAAAKEDVAALGLGIWPVDVAMVNGLGLAVIPRLQNLPDVSAQEVSQAFSGFQAGTVVFAGSEVLGYPHLIGHTAKVMRAQGLHLGLIENWSQTGFLDQAGGRQLYDELGEEVVRVYSIEESKQKARAPDDVVDIWARAVRERKIRLLYLHPFFHTADPVADTLNSFRELSERLAAEGFVAGNPAPLPVGESHRGADLLLAWGVAAAGLLLLQLLCPLAPGPRLIFSGLAFLAVTGLLFQGPLGRQLLALGAAIVFPALAVLSQVQTWPIKAIWGGFTAHAARGVVALISASAISLLGGLLVAGILTQPDYLNGWQVFRGVKISLLLPPLLVLVAVLTAPLGPGEAPSLRAAWTRLRGYLMRPLALGEVFVFMLILLAAFLYVARSGTILPVAGFELEARSFLESVFGVRPRTKEFLIGHPALFLAAVAASLRRVDLASLLAVAGAIGQVSIVNSFEHLFTPVVLSLLRGANGLTLGLVVGLAVTAVLWPFIRTARPAPWEKES